MSDNPFEAGEGSAPLLPGGTPELAGTGPDGAVFAQDGSVTPNDQPEHDPEGEQAREDDDNLQSGSRQDERHQDEV